MTTSMGKGVVRAKDTPNFIGNRVGVFSILAVFQEAKKFGRKLWLEKLRTKDALTVRDAFEKICKRAGVKCNSLMSDNGNEWLGEFSEYCRDNNIKQRFVRAYSPMANGIVERANEDVRKILNAFLLENDNLKWYTLLGKIEDNKNSAYHSSIDAIPNNIWVANKEKLSSRELPEEIVKTNPMLVSKVKILKKAIKQIRKFKEKDDYQEGDIVRVKMSSIFANVRKAIKEKNTKQLVVTYTPELFRIQRVTKPKGVLERNKYVLENEDGEALTKNGAVVHFYASELTRWDGGANDTHVTMDRAIELNGLERNRNDVKF